MLYIISLDVFYYYVALTVKKNNQYSIKMDAVSIIVTTKLQQLLKSYPDSSKKWITRCSCCVPYTNHKNGSHGPSSVVQCIASHGRKPYICCLNAPPSLL
jgi:hypothetical protein